MGKLQAVSSLGAALIALVCVPIALAGKAPQADSVPSERAASCGGLQPTLKGSRGDDTGSDKLAGTGKQDVISGGRGNDLAVGRGGDDFLCGGPGKDVLKGGAGDDLCIGGPGRDKMRGCEPVAVAPPPVTPPTLPTDPLPPDVDDPPVAMNNSTTVSEDSGATAIDVLANDTDPDGGAKTITSKTNGASGTVVITGGGTGLTYQPNANYCNEPGAAPADTFTYTLNGGSTATVSVTVTCVNDAPVVAAAGGPLNYTEDQFPPVLAPDLTVTDPDGTLTGATVAVAEPQAGDILVWTDNSGAIDATGSGTTATITFTGSATPAQYQAALRQVNYRTVSNTPSTTQRSVTFQVTDGVAQSALNAGSTVAVNVTASNDRPIVGGAGNTVAWSVGSAAVTLAPLLTVFDGESEDITSATVTSSSPPAGDALEWVDSNGGAAPNILSGNGTATLTLSGAASVAVYQAALRQVTFRSTSPTPSTADRTIRFQVTANPADGISGISALSTNTTTTVEVTIP